MKLAVLLIALIALMPIAALAQNADTSPVEEDGSEAEATFVEERVEITAPVSQSEPYPFAILRGLDKISGLVKDIKAPVGVPVTYGRLSISVEDCREPAADQAEDAFVFAQISDLRDGARQVFSGWMFASSPALSAMDHQRYDVWVLSCATS